MIHMWTPPLASGFAEMCDRWLSYVRPVCAAEIVSRWPWWKSAGEVPDQAGALL